MWVATWYLSGLADKQYRCLNSYWVNLNFYYDTNTKSNKGSGGSGHGLRFYTIRPQKRPEGDEVEENDATSDSKKLKRDIADWIGRPPHPPLSNEDEEAEGKEEEVCATQAST